MTGADDYEVNVLNDATGVTASGYPKLTTLLEEIATGLTSATKYRVFIKAHNAGGNSASSATVLAITLDDEGKTVNPPGVTINTSQSNLTSSVAQVTGGETPLQITFKHRTITGSKFTAEAPATLAASPTSHTKTIDASWADELGVEYYFVVKDVAGRQDSTQVQYAYKTFSSQEVSGFSGFTGKPASYIMFSIPADLGSNNDVNTVLQAVFAKFENYDKTKWRLFHWPGGEGESMKYLEFDAFNKIDKGQGYWFNAVENISGVTISGSVVQANQSAPFKIQLKKGWNQIGNPYPFAVSWIAIKNESANANFSLKSLYQFASGQYTKASDAFLPWRGAFVYSAADGEMTVPVTSKTTGGRVAEFDFPDKPDEGMWRLPIELSHGGIIHTSAIGMHPEASTGMDRFDEPELPRFIEYLEMKTRHEELSARNFAEDVVTSANHYSWIFTLDSNLGEGEAGLSWDPSAWEGRQDVFMLLDVSAEVLVDMKKNNRYSFPFSPGKQFKVIYSKDSNFKPGITMLGQAYPNPFSGVVQIPMLVESENASMQLEIYDMMGKRLKVIEHRFDAPGLYNMQWDGVAGNGEEASPGLLLYRLTDNKGKSSTVRRMIKSR